MLKIQVITHELDMTASPYPVIKGYEGEKIIDHDNSSDRKWLASHCFWALRNGRQVTTRPC